MAKFSNIVLVGFMGTGKTSVGGLVAARSGFKFIDMDDVIQRRTGKTIPVIFSEDGEPKFRSLERALVRELSELSGQVIAAGGGIVLNPDNIADFERTGLVVCLLASAEVILKRTASDTGRPLLAGEGKMDKIIRLLEARKKLYERIPHHIDTTDLSVEEVANGIMSLFGRGMTPMSIL
jgi:shikimate kinase